MSDEYNYVLSSSLADCIVLIINIIYYYNTNDVRVCVCARNVRN